MRRLSIASVLLSFSLPLGAQPIDVGGRILRPGGAALPGAAVELVSLGKDAPPAVKATSDATGAFRLQAPAPGLWKLAVRAQGSAPVEIELVPLIDPIELPPIELAPGGAKPPPVKKPAAKASVRLAGSVIDLASRKPLAGALVWPADDPAAFVRTGVDGRYAIAIAAPSTALRLRAAAVGYLPSEPQAVLSGSSTPAGSTARPGPTLALAPAAALGGTVLDAGGKPVAGAEITSFRARMGRPLPGDPGTRSAASGAFHLGRLSPRETYSLKVERPGFAPAALTVRAPRPLVTRGDLRIVLSRGLVAHGRVTDSTGRPLAGAEATLRPAARAAEEFGSADREPPVKGRSDPQGRFEIAGLTGGVFDLQVGARGFASVLVRGIDVRPGREGLGIVSLSPGVSLEGMVVDPTGQPIPDARVAGVTDGEEVVTGSDGRFTLPGLRDGETVTLRVERTGYLPSPAVIAGVRVPVAEPLRVVLRPGSRVRGRVADETGAPVSGARLLLTAKDRMGATACSNAEGRFTMEGVEPGQATLRVTAPGFLPVEGRAIEIPSGEDLEGLEVTLSRGAAVEGRVTTADGEPAAGALVQVVDRPDAGPLPAYATTAATTTTDGDGAYRLEGVAEGHRTIAAAHPEQPGAAGSLEVKAGTNHLDLHLPAGHEVTGRVVDTAGRPVGDARVSLSAPNLSREGDSLGDGSFHLPGLPDGAYHLTADKEGYSRVGEAPQVEVAGGPVAGLELRLERGGSITGRILGLDLLDPQALAGVEIWAGGPAGGRAGQADPAGAYRVENVPPGDWTVEARLPGGRQARGVVRLAPGQEQAVLDLELGADQELKIELPAADTAPPKPPPGDSR